MQNLLVLYRTEMEFLRSGRKIVYKRTVDFISLGNFLLIEQFLNPERVGYFSWFISIILPANNVAVSDSNLSN